MSESSPFKADVAATVRITSAIGGATAQSIPIPHGSGAQVRIRNRGSVDAVIEFGQANVQAVLPVPGTPGSQSFAPGAVEVQTVQQNQRFVSVVVASGTPDIEITVGRGG